MRRLSVVVVVLMFVLAAASCGGKQEEAQKAAEQAAEQAKSTGSPMGDAAAGMQQMADAFKQMAEGGGDAKEVEPVSFRELQTVLPDFGGWERGSPTGEKMSAPIAMSKTEVTYTKNDMDIEASVVDTGYRQMFFLPYMMMMAVGYEKESGTGYEKGTTVKGNPGFEKWDSDAKEGELAVVVNKRFFVQLRGRNINDTAVLRDFMDAVDLGKLSGMK
ncbi:MAG: hypothetical protein AB1806_09895 [Acidobacteriota bacterium]